MHELAVTRGILAVVLETAQQHGGGRITAIDLVVGTLSSIADDSVQFYFDFLSQGTIAEGASLSFRHEPATATCWNCRHQTEVQPPLRPACPACGGISLVVTGGREMYVESIEVNDENTGGEGNSKRE